MHLREMFARSPRNDLKSTFQNKIMIKKKKMDQTVLKMSF